MVVTSYAPSSTRVYTMNVNSGSSPTKKRKVIGGCADTADSAHDVSNDGGGFLSSWFGYFSGRGGNVSPATSLDVNNKSQLDRMEQMMMRMGEQLATVSSQCAALESKCSSLEDKLESISQTAKENDSKVDTLNINLDNKYNSLENLVKGKVDALHIKVDRAQNYHEYNAMILKNQSWEYSAVVPAETEWTNDGFEQVTADFFTEKLKDMTMKMRRGELPHEGVDDGVEGRGILFHPVVGNSLDVSADYVLPHWKEFTSALQQLTPAINLLPDQYDSYFHLGNVSLGQGAMNLLKEALLGKPFTSMSFVHSFAVDYYDDGGMTMDAILDVAESNKQLRKLSIRNNVIEEDEIERLRSVVHNHPLVELDIRRSWNDLSIDDGFGDKVLSSLLTSGELKLEKLNMIDINVTSGVSTLLADFLATNPRLKELNLEDNGLNDNDAELIANALRSNTRLRLLDLSGNDITDSGQFAFKLVLCDTNSLNAIADSNHSCHVSWLRGLNSLEVIGHNRGGKIYSFLSVRNECEGVSNVEDFSDIDVKLLPNMLEAVQKYEKNFEDHGEFEYSVRSLSIVYEVMRQWDKVVSLYGTTSRS